MCLCVCLWVREDEAGFERGRECCWWKVANHRNCDSSQPISVTQMHVHVKLFADWCSSCSLTEYVLFLHNYGSNNFIGLCVSSNDPCVCVLWQSRWVNTGGGRHCGLDMGLIDHSAEGDELNSTPPSAICGVADTSWFQRRNAPTIFAFIYFLSFFHRFLLNSTSAVDSWLNKLAEPIELSCALFSNWQDFTLNSCSQRSEVRCCNNLFEGSRDYYNGTPPPSGY